jgi:outer membrane immunogenic protein
MKKALIVAAATLTAGSAFSVFAADLPSRKAAPVNVPPPPMWTGFYAGLNAGGTWNNSSYQISSWPLAIGPGNPGPNPSGNSHYSATAILGIIGSNSTNSIGFIGGGQIGYDHQFGRVFVAGVEADIQGIAENSSPGIYWRNNSVLGVNLYNHNYLSGVSASKSLDYLGTLRGRVGYLFSSALLIYGTGGLAYGGANLSLDAAQLGYNHNVNYDTVGPGHTLIKQTRVGWTAGGGLEWMFMPDWSVKAEYLYYDLGSAQTSAGYTVAAKTRGANPQITFINGSKISSNFSGNIVRLGVNYHVNLVTPPSIAKF